MKNVVVFRQMNGGDLKKSYNHRNEWAPSTAAKESKWIWQWRVIFSPQFNSKKSRHTNQKLNTFYTIYFLFFFFIQAANVWLSTSGSQNKDNTYLTRTEFLQDVLCVCTLLWTCMYFKCFKLADVWLLQSVQYMSSFSPFFAHRHTGQLCFCLSPLWNPETHDFKGEVLD